MSYSKRLINAVKNTYPNEPDLHQMAEEGNLYLGRYLDDYCSTSIPLDTVLKATSLEQLKKIAQEQVKRLKVYHMWCEEDPRKK
jgi:hypothetical protein